MLNELAGKGRLFDLTRDGVVYRVEVDCPEVYRLPKVTRGDPSTPVSIPLGGGTEVDLFVDPLGNKNCDESVWAEARLF